MIFVANSMELSNFIDFLHVDKRSKEITISKGPKKTDPPLNVKKSLYSPHCKVKNGANPFAKLGYKSCIISRFNKNSCGNGISLGSTPASNNLFTGKET